MKNAFRVSEIELSYKHAERPSILPQITTAHQAYDIFHDQWDENRIEMVEDLKVLLLNTSNRVLGLYSMSNGGVTSTIADPRLIFAAALKANASSLVLAHNHPSGNLNPSTADKKLTDKLTKGGKLLDILVLDHLIITNEGFYSFKQDVSYDLSGRQEYPLYPNIPVLTV